VRQSEYQLRGRNDSRPVFTCTATLPALLRTKLDGAEGAERSTFCLPEVPCQR
jgi:hypothetical protein